ncbi:MAG: class I SAM-dependent methyltransferase [Thermoflexales bacterium]|nr:class I SAM-dependent methyltransferase [Thermoflexales bacterium]MCS7325626.1 class I SAM-dependent methyltransferase [Thermoflexales bacterium]MCX7938259.1 class I SAM-dependent methyltransferase [Thermoflexales bacterium]MDW8054355.1 class I SAM-dependent methyltransferase [Anaerolineae bacterium]MDW8291483.1 class I SAM-dependent methyltransferase [Anaerolineae bacterium]
MVDKRAARGVPSLVWRAGQERRLALINAYAPLTGARVLVDGCGIGLYVRAIARYTPHVVGIDIEAEHVRQGSAAGTRNLLVAAGEHLPFAEATFDVVLSHEVLEHVRDDRQACREMVRVLRPGGRAVVFVPNRNYPFETHGIYWRGRYSFGNKPLVNWLPDALRNRLAPHVRTYTTAQVRALFAATPTRIVVHTQIYPAFDNLIARRPRFGAWLRAVMHAFERTPLRMFGLSHFLVVERTV